MEMNVAKWLWEFKITPESQEIQQESEQFICEMI